jgi:hypothetical protein
MATLILAVFAFLMFILAVYFFLSSRSSSPVDSKQLVQKEISQLTAAVGKLIVLPEGEEPTVATVSDPEKLKDQEFFAKAQAGDKVLVYQKAGMAILYSVSLHKILEVAPIGANDTSASSSGKI